MSGTPVELTTNYFQLQKIPTWQVYQYHVDFSPTIDIRGLKNRLIFEQKSLIGPYLFDGTMLILINKLGKEVTEIISSDRDGISIQITIKFVVMVSADKSLQILNLILRKSMGELKLQLVGRNFYDAKAKVIFSNLLQLNDGAGKLIRFCQIRKSCINYNYGLDMLHRYANMKQRYFYALK